MRPYTSKITSIYSWQYLKVHEEESPHNSQSPITKGAVYLVPSGNLQCGYKFMALNSGKKIIRRNWYLIPMLDKVIACVNTLVSNQPKLFAFIDRHGRLIGYVETPGVGANSY